jgi:hypothetical protein
MCVYEYMFVCVYVGMIGLTGETSRVEDSQSHKREKYSHESRGTLKQELLCWREPAAIYLTDRSTDLAYRTHGPLRKLFHNISHIVVQV